MSDTELKPRLTQRKSPPKKGKGTTGGRPRFLGDSQSRIALRMPEELREAVEGLSGGLKLSAVVREALELWIVAKQAIKAEKAALRSQKRLNA